MKKFKKWLFMLGMAICTFCIAFGSVACDENGGNNSAGSDQTQTGGNQQGGNQQGGNQQGGNQQGGNQQGGNQQGGKYPSGASDPTADISIVLLANTDEKEFYSDYFAGIETKYGINISLKCYDAGDYNWRLDMLIQQGNTPDIFYVRPNEILQYKENIFCLDQFKDKIGDADVVFTNRDLNNLDLDDIYSQALDLYKYNEETNKMDGEGELYAFPKDLSTQQLCYNKTLIAQFATQIHAANLPLPWELGQGSYASKVNYTWTEYREMCEIIATEAVADYKEIYATDIPDIEILAKSFGGGILNTETMKVTIESQAVKDAIAYQHDLLTPSIQGRVAAADYENATWINFTYGKVAFYGMGGSWEVGQFNTALGEGNWGLMPWPTKDGSLNWQGKITSAGYAVSNKCKNWEAAMEIAASFMTYKVQDRLVREEKISLPINTKLTNVYLDPENDDQYSPSTRKIFIDVISGTHGFVPAVYSTFKDGWTKPLNDHLWSMWTGRSYTINATTQSTMQSILDSYGGQY